MRWSASFSQGDMDDMQAQRKMKVCQNDFICFLGTPSPQKKDTDLF